MEILSKENLVGAKLAPTAVFQDFQSLTKQKSGFVIKDSLLPQPEPDEKSSSDVGVGCRIGILKES